MSVRPRMEALLEAEAEGGLRDIEDQATSDFKFLMRQLKGSNSKMLGSAVMRVLADLGYIADKMGHEDVGKAIRRAGDKAAKLAR